MTALILVGLVPFAVLGILLGHLLTVDSMGPAIGGYGAVRPPRRGLGPAADERRRSLQLAKSLPSYWLVQAGKTARRRRLAGRGWIVIVVWTVGARRVAGGVGLPPRHGAGLTVRTVGRART